MKRLPIETHAVAIRESGLGLLTGLVAVTLALAACDDAKSAAPDADGVASTRTPPDERRTSLDEKFQLLPVGREIEDTVEYYEPRSLLHQAEHFAAEVVGDRVQWQGPYQQPQPDELTQQASVWLTIYPRAVIAAPAKSVLGTLATPEHWDTLADMGFQLMHALSPEQAGQIDGPELSPSIDGGFDRISLAIEPRFGTEQDMRDLVRSAAERNALIAGDVIPLHTGVGPDFQLALMNYEGYPGIYNIIEIPPEDWRLLPGANDRFAREVIRKEEAAPLIERGYMPGIADVLLEHPDSNNWSGWAATGEVPGADGQTRRWIYAHLFKAGQPMLNWMDPTYAGRVVQTGTMVRHVQDLGVRVNRLDAVPFLGVDIMPNSSQLSIYGTELATSGVNDLAFTSRKLGGFTWVELNVPIDAYLEFNENGADMAYDFFTRAETLHPLISGDARVLRAVHRTLLERGVDHSALMHAMQNHDEITYQLVSTGALEQIDLGAGETVSGAELKERILQEMRESVAGDAAPYNRLYRPEQDGVATTYAGFIAPALGIGDPYSASAEDIASIQQGHILIVMATAMQPGVFAISEWDLVGALPIPVESVAEQTAEGDFRWINRGGVDLFGDNPDATASADELARAQTLYGALPEQLDDPDSFASQVKSIIAGREKYDIGNAQVVDVPQLDDDALCVLIMRLPGSGVAVTALNYGGKDAMASVDLAAAVGEFGSVSGEPRDAVSEERAGTLSGTQLRIPLGPLSGRTVIVDAMIAGPEAGAGAIGGSGGTGTNGSGGMDLSY